MRVGLPTDCVLPLHALVAESISLLWANSNKLPFVETGLRFANGYNVLMSFFKPYPPVFAARLRYIIKRMFNVIPNGKFVC